MDAGKPTFGHTAASLLDAKESEWRNEKHRGQWRRTLESYAAALWAMPVDEVDTEAVLGVNAGEILQRLAGVKVQHGRKQEGP
jgi:hypothetical protein